MNTIKHNIEWSKCHNGVMLCSFDRTRELMPEVSPILDELLNGPMLELDKSQYLIDVKVHMLMPDQYPCIPNWHRDFMPRDCKGERTKGTTSTLKMFMWLSGAPLTEYIVNKKKGVFKPAQQWNSFTQDDIHRGTMSDSHLWRGLIRVIPASFKHETTINAGKIRKHTQVYLDTSTFKW
jgi:hypothetical protein